MSSDSSRSFSSAGWWSLSERPDPTPYAIDGGVQPVTGEALSALLTDVLARGVPFRFAARGFSMFPFIRDGDTVTISPLRGRRARFGEVVVFAGPTGGPVVHRVTARRPGSYEIRGDCSSGHDDVVPAASVLGAVTRVERRGRRVRLGLGPERALAGGLSRLGLLQPLVAALRAAREPFVAQGVL
jgi:hypothetical protein